MRDFFIGTIADFAREGKIRLGNNLIPGFTSNANNFIEISSQPKVSDKFRYCEMALWAGLGERLKDVSCAVKDTILDALGAPIPVITDVQNQLGTENLTNTLTKPLGGLLSPSSSNPFGNMFG